MGLPEPAKKRREVVPIATREIAKVVERLRAQSETIQDEDLAHISPLICTHVVPNGTYRFEQADLWG